VRQVYATRYLQTSVILPHVGKLLNGAAGAFLTAWGKADDVLTAPIPEQSLEANRLLGWGVDRFRQDGGRIAGLVRTNIFWGLARGVPSPIGPHFRSIREKASCCNTFTEIEAS
jgi:hypothetical protein